MRATGAAIRRRRRGIGVHVAESHPIVRHTVGAWYLGRGDDRQDDSVRGVRAAVVDEVHIERDELAVVVETDLDLVDLAALLVHRSEMLLPVLGPFHGPAELQRGERNEE